MADTLADANSRIAELEAQLRRSGAPDWGKTATSCEACRKAKVKCDRGQPCCRCAKLSIPCVPTGPSMRGRKRARTAPGENILADAQLGAAKRGAVGGSSSANTHNTQNTQEDILAFSATTNGPGALARGAAHWGIMWLLRDWVSIAVRRRSISLLGKAAALAERCGISMDELLLGEHDGSSGGGSCGGGSSGGGESSSSGGGSAGGGSGSGGSDNAGSDSGGAGAMGHLPALLLNPASGAELVGPRLQLADLPPVLLGAFGWGVDKGGPTWGMGRFSKDGVVSYYASAGFERDIVTWEETNATFIENKQSTNDRFMLDQVRPRHLPPIPPRRPRLQWWVR